MYRLETSNAVWISCSIMTSETEESTRHQRIMKKIGQRELKSVPIDLIKGTLQSPRTACLLLVCVNLLYGGTSYFERSPLCWTGWNSPFFDEMQKVHMKILQAWFLYFIKNNFFVENNFHFLTNSSERLVFCLLLVNMSKSFAGVFIISASKPDR